jgi:hypothetical protein
VPGFGPTAGAALASHMDVNKVRGDNREVSKYYTNGPPSRSPSPGPRTWASW